MAAKFIAKRWHTSTFKMGKLYFKVSRCVLLNLVFVLKDPVHFKISCFFLKGFKLQYFYKFLSMKKIQLLDK